MPRRGFFAVADGRFFTGLRFAAESGSVVFLAPPAEVAARFAALGAGDLAVFTPAFVGAAGSAPALARVFALFVIFLVFAVLASAGLAALRARRGLCSRRAFSNGIALSSENVSGSASRGNDAMTPS